MKKYTTKPIDFTGCHPIIAEHLKRGEAIECFAHDNNGYGPQRHWITAYWRGATYPYRTGTEAFRYAEPTRRKVRRIMPPERAIPTLIAEGWAFTSAGYLTGPSCVLVPKMYALMGGDVDGEANEFAWPPCIIEEVEDDK